MYQYDDPSCVASLPAPAAAGTPGYFTDGNPVSGQAPTILTADYMNSLMLELLNVVKAAGITPGKTVYDQLLSAIRRIGQNTVVLADVGTANAYAAANGTPLVAATWVDGVVQAVKIAHTNTGASTYAPDGLAAIPVYGLGLQPLQGGELWAGGTAIFMRTTIASVNSGNPICVLMECAGGAQQIPSGSYGSTPAQFDNSTKLATTGFVQRALGNRQSGTRIQSASSAVLSASQAGGFFTLEVASTAYVLPALSSVQPGATFEFLSIVSGATVSTSGADKIMTGSVSSVSSFVLNNGDTARLVSNGQYWVLVGGSAALRSSLGDFAVSIGGIGYQKLPSGIFVQWGFGNAAATGTSAASANVTFPLAFPSAVRSIVISSTGAANSSAGGQPSTGARLWSLTGFVAVLDSLGFTTFNQASGFSWIAVGN